MSEEQKIGPGKVVSLEYVLTNPKGEELDRSAPEQPLQYLHGARNVVPGLEEALVGKTSGEELRVEVPPEKGYGVKDKRIKPQKMLRSKFPPEADVRKGARFLMQGPDGRPFPIYVTKVMGKQVHVTPEHPLVGVTLCFDVKIGEIRDATEEEQAHGHVHGPGGVQHDEEEE